MAFQPAEWPKRCVKYSRFSPKIEVDMKDKRVFDMGDAEVGENHKTVIEKSDLGIIDHDEGSEKYFKNLLG